MWSSNSSQSAVSGFTSNAFFPLKILYIIFVRVEHSWLDLRARHKSSKVAGEFLLAEQPLNSEV